MTVPPPSLEVALLEMEMLQYRPWEESFSDHVDRVLGEFGGRILFNTRIDDEAYQRCVGALISEGEEEETVALLFLRKDGRFVDVEEAHKSSHPIAPIALNEPSRIGLCWPSNAS